MTIFMLRITEVEGRDEFVQVNPHATKEGAMESLKKFVLETNEWRLDDDPDADIGNVEEYFANSNDKWRIDEVELGS